MNSTLCSLILLSKRMMGEGRAKLAIEKGQDKSYLITFEVNERFLASSDNVHYVSKISQ